MAKNYSLARYRAEANSKPFVLELGGKADDDIVIQPPDGDTFLELGNIPMNEGRHLLSLLCGDKFGAVMDVLGNEPAPVLIAVVQDMLRHFGITGAGDGPGGQRALPR